MKEKKSYFGIKRVRLDDELWEEWQKLKDKNCRTMNAVLARLLQVYAKKQNKIVGQSTEIVGQKDEGENEMLDIFYKINPTIKYGNKTQRSAVTRLYQKLGKDKALRSAEAAIAVHGKPFAPTITTPIHLENKLSELVAFYKKNQVNQIIEV